MANASLTTYLNDHLAGSVAALELLSLLESWTTDDEDAAVLSELSAGISADRDELETIMARLDISKSRPRQVMAWMTEKVTEWKIKLDDSSGGAMRQLEGIEMVTIGIEGKQALWHSLAAAANLVPELAGVDYDRLLARGADQRQRIETLRLAAAQAAFSSSS